MICVVRLDVFTINKKTYRSKLLPHGKTTSSRTTQLFIFAQAHSPLYSTVSTTTHVSSVVQRAIGSHSHTSAEDRSPLTLLGCFDAHALRFLALLGCFDARALRFLALLGCSARVRRVRSLTTRSPPVTTRPASAAVDRCRTAAGSCPAGGRPWPGRCWPCTGSAAAGGRRATAAPWRRRRWRSRRRTSGCRSRPSRACRP